MGNLLYCCFVVEKTTPSIQRYVNEHVNFDNFLSRREKRSILLYLLKVIRDDKLLNDVYDGSKKKYSVQLYGCKNPSTEVINFINYILVYLKALSYTQKRLLYIIIAENMISSFIGYINTVFTSSVVKFKDSERCIEELFIETGLYISSQGYTYKKHTEVMEELIYLYILAKLFKQLL
ncbi:m132L [Myxoma virus]|nr:m132L [Myxoma virus]AMB18464.1 m132L [Myxoma virus]